MVTDTVEETERSLKCIRVRLSPEAGGGRGRRGRKRKDMGNSRDERPFDSRGSDNWPEHLGKFLRLVISLLLFNFLYWMHLFVWKSWDWPSDFQAKCVFWSQPAQALARVSYTLKVI